LTARGGIAERFFRAAADAAWVDSWSAPGLFRCRSVTTATCDHPYRPPRPRRQPLYTLDALVLNFNDFDPKHPERVVESRLDRLMTPQTRWETEGPYPDSVGNVLFSCGRF